MTQQANRDAWRKFLGITDARNGRADSRTGVGVGRSAGRASGAGSTDRDGNPEGQAGESAENGDGSLNGGKGLQVGDKGDRLTDLYDCETGEEVTIDGLGEKGTEAYPSGFHDCIKKPSSDVYYFQGRVFTVHFRHERFEKRRSWQNRYERNEQLGRSRTFGSKKNDPLSGW